MIISILKQLLACVGKGNGALEATFISLTPSKKNQSISSFVFTWKAKCCKGLHLRGERTKTGLRCRKDGVPRMQGTGPTPPSPPQLGVSPLGCLPDKIKWTKTYLLRVTGTNADAVWVWISSSTRMTLTCLCNSFLSHKIGMEISTTHRFYEAQVN